MRKTFWLIFILILCMLYPQKANAEENLVEVNQEFVIYEDGVEVSVKDSYIYNGSTIIAQREKTYDGIIVPPSTITISTEEGGIKYSGTLYLASYRYSNNQTIAIYKGTLVAVN